MTSINVSYTLWTGLKTLYLLVQLHVLPPLVLQIKQNTDLVTQEMVDWHSLTIVTKTTSSDTPNWNQAMNGPNANGYWDAMAKETKALTGKNSWV